MAEETAADDAERPPEPPQPLRVPDPPYTIEVEANGLRNASDPHDQRTNYALRIIHQQYGKMHEETHCADSTAFCIHKGNKVIARLRREEEARRGVEIAENST